ncbi:histidine phosphatase family protein [Nocardia huaxiensis]|uniref:phosphoglycerate mutase (2,3-diphosphoglycerate-dependent) n=2 Tax=Nocardia huaxiensis TaxID=2755382 RepID=A0A7D6VGW0_9NOCA|nr:histidine phosphatase family protein [Nocardia huaxiensis]
MVRHGESTANAAFTAAIRASAEEFERGTRDPDIPLSDRGRAQAEAVGVWLTTVPRPDLVLSSPYIRARDTASIALRAIGSPPARQDERLRDREIGILAGLTALGIRRRYPLEHRERERLGRFYYRPPGGESYTDVALRLRTLLPELEGHVLAFAHDNIVLLTRYILANLDEPAVLHLESTTPIANASVTRWERTPSGLELIAYNDTAHLRAPEPASE